MIFRGPGYMGNNSAIEVAKDGVVTFGKNFGITSSFRIASRKSVTIGDNFSSSWDVQIFDTDFHNLVNVDTMQKNESSAPVYIGDDVWLANRCTVLKGSYIPTRSIVASNSMFTNKKKSNEQNVIYAGTPAVIVKRGWTREEFLAFEENPISDIVKYLGL